MRSFNANFIIEKNKRGASPINLVKFDFTTPKYISDRDVTPSGGSAHSGLIKAWGFIDSNIERTPGSSLIGNIEICDLQITIINSESPRFSDNFTAADPPENVTVTLYQWFTGLLDSEKELMFKGVVWGQPKYDLYECRLTIRGIFEKYNKLIGEDLIVNATDYPDAIPEDIGKMLPLAWGDDVPKVPFRCVSGGGVTTLIAEDDIAATLYVTDSALFDAPGIVLIDSEEIYYTASASNELTGLTRGFSGTTPAGHSKGAEVREILGEMFYSMGCAIKAINNVFIIDRSSGLAIRQSGNYTAYTGQPGDQHADYGAKGILQFGYTTNLPSGIIVPFNDTSLPSGWEWFSSADGKMIVGAGTAYGIGDTGGSVSISETSDSKSHGSSSGDVGTNGAGYHGAQGAGSAKSHTHTIGFDYLPEYQDIRLIRATSDQDNFPAKAIVLTHADTNPNPANLTIEIESDKFLRANSSISTGGGSESNVSINSAGNHTHHAHDNFTYGGAFSGYSQYATDRGSHDHNDTFSSFSDAENIKKTYLRAWSDTSGFYGRGMMIAMWESLTPPDGWFICNGSNGTPDLRDYFIVLSSSGNAGTQEGDNTVEFTIEAESDGAHTHGTIFDMQENMANYYHGASQGTHTHALATPSQSYTPPYYALIFIMKKPIDATIQSNMVVADIDGYQDDGSGTYTGTPNALIERPDYVFKHIWAAILGASSGDLDLGTSGTYYAANSYKFCHAITEPIEARIELMRLAFQCRSRFFVSPYGTAKLIVRQTGQASGHAIPNIEIKESSVSIERSPTDDIINYFNIYYNLDYSKDKDITKCLAVKKLSDSTSISRYGQKELKESYSGGNILLFDAVSDDTMAAHVGAFILEWFKSVRDIVHFAVFLDNMEIEPGDLGDITHALNSMSGFVCEVLKTKHVFGSAKANRIDHLQITAIEN